MAKRYKKRPSVKLSTREKILTFGAVGLAAVGLGSLGTYFQYKLNGVDEAKTYLENKGFTNVEGGDANFWNGLGCRKGELKRDFTAKNKEGQTVKVSVCNGWGMRPHMPWHWG